MQDRIDVTPLTRLTRARLLTVAALASGVLMAGCGGSSISPTAPTVGGGGTPASALGGSGASSGSSASGAYVPGRLGYAKCMRAHGVPDFPDPSPGGNIQLHPGPGGIDPSSPALNAAWVKCQKLQLATGFPAAGAPTHPSEQTLSRLLKVSECMRQHGVAGFPDPRTSVPSDASPGRYGMVVDDDGAILAVPSSINTPQTGPAYWQAATACGIGGQHQ
jgi:hypothetical protein